MLLALVASALAAPRWTVTVDPLTTGLGFVHVQVERSLGPHVSLYAGPSLRLFSIPTTEPEPFIGVGVELGLRWFFLSGRGEAERTAPLGPWLMTRGVAARLYTTDGSDEASWGRYNSVLIGYTGLVGEHFVLSGGAGAQHFDYQVGGYGLSGFAPALHTNLGVAF